METFEESQKTLCKKYNVEYYPSPESSKVGIAFNVKTDILPINGFRHNPEAETTGWYIYAGEELSDAIDFFQPLHIKHIPDWNPLIMKF